MADRGYAEAGQIVGRQLRQSLGVDIVVTKRGLVLLEREPAQPFGYIHRDCLTTANRGPLQSPCGILSRWGRNFTGLRRRRGGPSPERWWKEAPYFRPSHR